MQKMICISNNMIWSPFIEYHFDIATEFFFKTLIFEVFYFLKMCPIFVSSVHNFGKSDDDII